MWKKLFFLILILLIPFTFSYAQSIKLQDYKPKNQDEVSVIQMLKGYLEGWQTKDKQKILACCLDNVELMERHGKYLTKKEMIKTNVDNWTSSKWYDFYDPMIMFDGNKATVNAFVARAKGNIGLYLQMLRKNQQWLILKQEYQF